MVNIYICIWTNYCTVHICFSKLLEKFVIKYVSTYKEGSFKKKTSAKDVSNDAYVMFSDVCVCFSQISL